MVAGQRKNSFIRSPSEIVKKISCYYVWEKFRNTSTLETAFISIASCRSTILLKVIFFTKIEFSVFLKQLILRTHGSRR